MKKVILKINGMHCVSCSIVIDGDLEELEGVNSSNTSYAKQLCVVEYEPEKINTKNLLETIKKSGYEAALSSE